MRIFRKGVPIGKTPESHQLVRARLHQCYRPGDRVMHEWFDYEDALLADTAKALSCRRFSFEQALDSAASKQGSVVAELGCGFGNTIEEIRKRHPGARCVGFSRGYYPQWAKKKESGVDFVWEDFGRIGTAFRSLFGRDGEGRKPFVDFFFSRRGLDKINFNKLMPFVRTELVPRLKPGGYLVFDWPNQLAWRFTRLSGPELSAKVYTSSLWPRRFEFKDGKWKTRYSQDHFIIIIRKKK